MCAHDVIWCSSDVLWHIPQAKLQEIIVKNLLKERRSVITFFFVSKHNGMEEEGKGWRNCNNKVWNNEKKKSQKWRERVVRRVMVR
jgi:hypothetical protein